MVQSEIPRQSDNALVRHQGSYHAPQAARRVLLVAYDFPPRRTSGVYRPTAFTKYLPQFGWQPTVLTIQPPANAVSDAGLLNRVPASVRVERTRQVRLDWWEDRALEAVRSAGALQPVADRSSPEGNASQGHSRWIDRALRRAARFLRACLYFPDETAGWIPFAFSRALQLHLAERFDAVYTTHPPRAAHPVGLLLSSMCRLPWVMEFRDPWTLPGGEVSHIHTEIAPRRNAWLHQVMLRQSSAVVTVTKRHAQELQRHFKVQGEKLSVIPNGFDEEDFRGLIPDGKGIFDPQFINLAHFGTVYEGFSGQFFRAAEMLLLQHPEWMQKVRFHVIGFPDGHVQAMTQGDPLKSVVVLHKFIPHGKALQVMAAADALLLFYGQEYTSRASIPGKLYEYLRVGRPILAVAFPGGVQELIETSRAGWVLLPDDIAGMKAVLSNLIHSRMRGQEATVPEASIIAGFRYERLAQELAAVLNRVAHV
jgi:glycosyltransferase involved in cell wall biosynthesis